MTKLLIKLFIKAPDNVGDVEVKQKYGYLGACTGIALNIFLFLGKLIAGLVSGAISVMADAFNNLSDAGSSIMTLIGFKIAGAPADEAHPFGHGRMEYISGLIISFIIMLMGIELGKTSFTKIFHPQEIEFSYLTLGILIASVAVKLWMGIFNKKLGTIINSTSMKAAAADSISDCIATTAVIIAMLISTLAGVNVDGYVGILVALFIFWSGINACRDSVSPLLGNLPDAEFVKEIEDKVNTYEGIIGVHDLIVNDYGMGNLVISMHAEVPCTMDFTLAHELIDQIEDDLKAEYKCLVTIHMDPVAYNDEATMQHKAMVEKIVTDIDSALSIHDFRMTKGESRVNLIFDVVIPYNIRMTPKEITDEISDKIYDIDKKYFVVINVDRKMA